MRPADDSSVTLSFDLLWNGLEVTTGAQREHRHDVLLKQAAEKGMSTEPMQDYLNAFRYGCPPHGGLGMGLGRVLMVMLGLTSIREATFLFRGPNRLTPSPGCGSDPRHGQEPAPWDAVSVADIAQVMHPCLGGVLVPVGPQCQLPLGEASLVA
jgi:hypothetical protein